MDQGDVGATVNGEKRKRTRGTTMCKKIWGMEEGERIHISLNEELQPVGKNASQLNFFLGALARKTTFAPIQYEDWRLMPEKHKSEMWNMVKEKFDIDILAKPWVMSSLDKKWKNFKASVKRGWTKHNIRDTRVTDDDWAWLLKFWSGPKAVKCEFVAKANRNGLDSAHTMGTKSYARMRYELKQSRPDKSEPSRAEVYIKSHVRSNGEPLNKKVAETVGKLKEKMESNVITLDDTDDNDLLAEVMEKEKCKPNTTFGLGTLKGAKSSRMLFLKEALVAKTNAENRERKMEEEMNKMKEQQEKIIFFLEQSNPGINLNEIMSPPNEGDNDITEVDNHDGFKHVRA
ncbi:hypothetical protein LINGRAHAP2_LOCUS14384 [Linum grandiflorum]